MLGGFGTVVEHAINAVAYREARLEGLEMDVGGVLLDGLEQDQVDQARDGSRSGRLEQVAGTRHGVGNGGGSVGAIPPGRIERADVAAGVCLGMRGVGAGDRAAHHLLVGDHAAQRTSDHLRCLLVYLDARGVGHQQARLAADTYRQDIVTARPGQRQKMQLRHEHGVVHGKQEGQPQTVGLRAPWRQRQAWAAGLRGLGHDLGFPS